jgi:predicted phage baseplate assembly protein
VHDPEGTRGVANTLQLFVDDELWTEVETLADSGPDDHVYQVSIAETGKMSVTFGDGRFGAKLPTGRNNVRAVYRVGLGSAANVTANAVSTLSSPPSFLQSSRNPVASSGGADAESPETTRVAAPVTVRTLDRAVSVSDYADLALSFAGIAKARADLARSGGQPLVQLTVATAGGLPLSLPVRNSLAAYLDTRRSPHLRFRIQDYLPHPIRLHLEIQVLPAFTQAETKLRVIDALGANGYFQFDRRQLGESLYLSDIYSIAQSVQGVNYLDVRAFQPETGASLSAKALDVIHLPQNAIATGGDPANAEVGILLVYAAGGIS